MRRTKSNEANKTYAAGFSYAAQGAVTALSLGNGLVETMQYNARSQPTQLRLAQGGTDVLRLDYTYAATTNNGNLLSQRIVAPGLDVTQGYGYDALNRLASASEAGSWSRTFAYDRYGNGWVSGYTGITPGVLTPLAQSQVSASSNRIVLSGFVYDAAGNLTNDSTGAGMAYDGENRLKSHTKMGATTAYSYDGDGRRVQKVAGGVTTIYVYNASGQLIAEYDTGTPPAGGTKYVTADHLGSTRVVTSSTGAVVARHDYLPFGEEIDAGVGGRTTAMGYSVADTTRQRFTAKERDGESGLDYFLARYYSAAQGRFTSPDPLEIVMGAEDEDEALAFLNDPRSWNKYAYTYNNPLRFVDPDGQRPQDSFHNRIDQANRDRLAGRISEQQYWERLRAGVGAIAGLGVVAGVAGGTRIASAILLWAARNPDKLQQIGQELLQSSTGSPAPTPRLGTPLSGIFGASDNVILSGRYVEGRLGDALIGGQFTKSGDKLTAGIIGAYANNAPVGRTLHSLFNSIKDFARQQGASQVEIQAIAVVNKDLVKALVKQGFQKTTVVVDGEKVEAYVKTIQLR